MNCCRALIVNLQKVFYNSQASVGDRQYTIILFISIIFLPTILNYFNDRERGRHYHFVGFYRPPMPPPPTIPKYFTILMTEMRDSYFCRILAPPNAPPPPLTPKYLTILVTERGGAIVFCRILAPPNDPPPQTPQYLTILQTERGRALPLVGFWRPPMPPPLPRRHNT